MRRFGESLTWLVAAVFVLSLAAGAWAQPSALSTTPPSSDPIPRCIQDAADQADQLGVLRTGCDALAFLSGYGLGFIRPCASGDAECSQDGNGESCMAGDTLWLCFGTGSTTE